MAKARTTWVVVADGKQARIYANHGPGSGLEPVSGGEFSAPDVVPRQVEDSRGRSFDRFGMGRHAIDSIEDQRREVQRLWAKFVAHVLEEAAAQKKYRRLVVVAPARMLGDLRDAIPDQVQKLVDAEVRKELVHATKAQLEKQLEGVVRL